MKLPIGAIFLYRNIWVFLNQEILFLKQERNAKLSVVVSESNNVTSISCEIIDQWKDLLNQQAL